jgi:hypothetical protein
MSGSQSKATSEARSQTGCSAVQSGGAGAEKTPASSDTPQNISASMVSTRRVLYFTAAYSYNYVQIAATNDATG